MTRLFSGDADQFTKVMQFESALTQAKASKDTAVEKSAIAVIGLLRNATGKISEDFQKEIDFVLKHYAELLVSGDEASAAKLSKHIRSLEYLTNPTLLATELKGLTPHEASVIAVARAMQTDLGIDQSVVIKSIADIKALGTDKKDGLSFFDKAEAKEKEFKKQCE